MKRNAFNPYLPSWEYVPDGEPYVFGDRVYVYGSHDRFDSLVFCSNDYVCWSAPVDDLGAWRYEGVIFKKTDDPLNADESGCLYAPDLTQGPDGRYYLYYCIDNQSLVSVAVCDTPAGEFKFYGHVHHADGTPYGEKEGDAPRMFDPGVLTEGDVTYLYTGFCPDRDKISQGPAVCVLDKDMLTMLTAPKTVIPNAHTSAGTGFEGHAFFEASSIRKRGDTYYFVYSSEVMHELCYATSKDPLGGFVFGGVLVSNNDIGIDSYKPKSMPTYFGGNNHGSIIQLGEQWYVFYHRHTNGTHYSRQVCAEPIFFGPDGSICQAQMTSCGLNGGPLPGIGKYPAYIACNLFYTHDCRGKMSPTGIWQEPVFPMITQDGQDGTQCPGYIRGISNGTVMGFKFFACKDLRRIQLTVRGYGGGEFQVRTQLDGDVIGRIPVEHRNVWTDFAADVSIPDGIHALYFTYSGEGVSQLLSFELI